MLVILPSIIGSCFHLDLINSSNPRSDQNLISPFSNTAKSFTKIMRTKEMIANLRNSDCWTNSPYQNYSKYKEKSLENKDTDVRG